MCLAAGDRQVDKCPPASPCVAHPPAATHLINTPAAAHVLNPAGRRAAHCLGLPAHLWAHAGHQGRHSESKVIAVYCMACIGWPTRPKAAAAAAAAATFLPAKCCPCPPDSQADKLLVTLAQGSSSGLLADLHCTLLRLIQADMGAPFDEPSISGRLMDGMGSSFSLHCIGLLLPCRPSALALPRLPASACCPAALHSALQGLPPGRTTSAAARLPVLLNTA